MQVSLHRFWLTILVVWLLGIAGALYYAQLQNIPARVVIAFLPALLLELAMYLATGFESARTRLSALGKWLPAALAGASAVTYLLFALPLGSFRWDAFATVTLLTAALAYWYRVLPGGIVTDLGFLLLAAGIILSKIFASIYLNPDGKPDASIIGKLMWWRTGILAALLIRGAPRVDFGWVPRRRDWQVGALFCAYSLLLLVPMALWLGIVQQPATGFTARTALTAMGTFVGALWFIALGEELFFRGLLQQWLSDFTGSARTGLVLASVIFGSVHLWFRGFPNFKHAAIATVLGVFCGLAYSRAGFRSAMVTHALVVTAWRVAFR